MPSLGLNRQLLATITNNPQAIRALEQAFGQLDATPGTVEEAQAAAAQAIAATNAALSLLADLADAVAGLVAPAFEPAPDSGDYLPAIQTGSLGEQSADAVDITGGTVGLDAGSAAAPSIWLGSDHATGLYRSGPDKLGITTAGIQLAELSFELVALIANMTITGQIRSSVPTGSAPLVIDSSTRVPNLNADLAGTADVAYVAGLAAGLTDPSAFPPDATDLPTAIALVNALRAAAITKGL